MLRIGNRRKKQYYDLIIWNKGLELTVDIYNVTSSFPETEKFGLSNQMRRAVVSIPSNIAEGYGRYNQKEFVHFLRIAKGSLFELDTQLIISLNLGFVSEEDYNDLSISIDNLHFMLLAFINRCSQKG